MVLYLVEQLPHCDLLRLIHQTERFVCWLASLSIKSVMDSFIFLFFFGHGYGLVGYLKLEHNLHLSNIWVAWHMPNASIWVARHGKTWLIPFLESYASLFNSHSSMGECLRPYHVENTSSRLIPEVKQHRATSVLGWVTAWEYAVL